jgi:hypothetical protein
VSERVIGISQGGAPVVVTHLGEGTARILLIAGQHGWPERNTVWLADTVVERFGSGVDVLPGNLRLDVIRCANPDGMVDGRRLLRSGVDPNRNWHVQDWQQTTFNASGLHENAGGAVPFSETETRSLGEWVGRIRYSLVINYHSRGGFVSTDHCHGAQDLAERYALAAGYAAGPTAQYLGYPVTGSMDAWLESIKIPYLFIELGTYDDPETEQNLAGLRAILPLLTKPPYYRGPRSAGY